MRIIFTLDPTVWNWRLLAVGVIEKNCCVFLYVFVVLEHFQLILQFDITVKKDCGFILSSISRKTLLTL